MIRLVKERDELKIIADQVGTPTYAIDLAKAILKIISTNNAQYAIYHFSNEGVTSSYDFTYGIFDISKIAVKLCPIDSIGYPTKAKRPSFSVMDKTKIKETFKLEIPYWRTSLEMCIDNLLKTN